MQGTCLEEMHVCEHGEKQCYLEAVPVSRRVQLSPDISPVIARKSSGISPFRTDFQATFVTPALWRPREEELEFKATFWYIMSLKPFYLLYEVDVVRPSSS